MDIIQFVNLALSNLALSNNLREKKIIRILFLYHDNNWAVDQADGQSVKLLNRIIVSSWMGDPMATSCQAHGSWICFFLDFFFTKNLLLMFLKILVQKFCVSMETCNM